MKCVFVGGGRRPTVYSVSVMFARAGTYVKEARTLATTPIARERSWIVVAACRMKIPTIITVSKMQAIIWMWEVLLHHFDQIRDDYL